MFVKVFKSLVPLNVRGFASKIRHNSARPRYVDDTRQVELRGTYIKGNYDDLPTLIFFPEACDSALNWSAFFTSPNNQFLDYRNVYLLYPRNFGNSDRNPSYDMEEVANDVARFMYENQISTATLGGHGFGAKVALAVGCYHGDRVTGVVAIDSSPMDHRYHEAFHEFKSYINRLQEIDMKTDRGNLERSVAKAVEDPKWRKIFSSSLTRVGDYHDWNFALEYLNKNVSFNKADSIGYWAEKNGLYTGRAFFIFPEYSRWVHLATNTLPMMKVCPRVEGYGKDIIAVQGEEVPDNHWVYDLPEEQELTFARKILQFIRLYDGVHVLLTNRTEIGKEFIPDRKNSRDNSEHIYSDYSPAHVHHNWRFSNIYDVSKQFREGATSSVVEPTKKQ